MLPLTGIQSQSEQIAVHHQTCNKVNNIVQLLIICKTVPDLLATTDSSSAIRQVIPHVHLNENSTQLRTQMVDVRHPIASTSVGNTAYASSLQSMFNTTFDDMKLYCMSKKAATTFSPTLCTDRSPTQHKIGNFRDVLPSQSLALVLKNKTKKQQKQTCIHNKIYHYTKETQKTKARFGCFL